VKILEIVSVSSFRGLRAYGSPLSFTCLIFGKEYKATATNFEHMIEKILFKDIYATREDIMLDLQLNYPQYLPTHEKTDPDSIPNVSQPSSMSDNK
jgi:hypothetical protein